MVENGLLRKLRLISKFMMSQTGKQIIAIHILPNISRSKDNQEMMFGQLTEHNIKNTFLKNQTKNAVRKLVPNRSIKTQN